MPAAATTLAREQRVAAVVAGAARVALLAGPTVLAFMSGGFFDHARLLALIVAWALVGVAAAVVRRPLPGGWAGVALAGIALLAGWIWISELWAPQADRADAEVQRALLYLGALIAAAALLRARASARRVEPALAAGSLVVIGYALAGRLLPGIVFEHRSVSAGGRLEQPLTYWNAAGALAALGFVLCARLAGDRSRAPWLRSAAAAAAVPLGCGVYLSFSRGALVAGALGLGVLLALAPEWSQLRAIAIALAGAAVATIVSALEPGVASLAGSNATREREGAIALAVIVVAMVAVAVAQALACRAEAGGRTAAGRLPLPRWAPALAVALMLAAVAGAVVAAASSSGGGATAPAFGATAQRLGTLGSNRYAYWRVALDVFATRPLQGVGAGGFASQWLRRRHIDESVQDAHSLELQTAAEEGLVGLALLALLFAGVAGSARRGQRADPLLTAGPVAALATWTLHSALDWDWQMPALTLVAAVLAGLLLARAAQQRAA